MNLAAPTLLKSASLYIVANILNGIVPFLLIPVFTKYLTPVDFGHIAMFVVLVNVFSAITSLNIHGAINRFYFDKDEIDLPTFIGTSQGIFLVMSVFCTMLFFLCTNYIAELTQFPKEWLFAVVIASFFQSPVNIALGLKRVQNQPIQYAKIDIGQTLIHYLLALLLVAAFQYDWTGRVIGQVVATSVVGLACMIQLYRQGWISRKWNSEYAKTIIRFCVPLTIHGVSILIFANMDRLLLVQLDGLSSVGLFALAAQFATVISLLASAFNRAYSPWLFGILKKADDKAHRELVRLTYTHLLISFGCCLALALSIPMIFKFFVDEKFSSAQAFANWLILGAFFNVGYLMITNYIIYAKKTNKLAAITIVTGIISAVLIYVLILKYGAIGAAIGGAAGQFLKLVITWYVVHKDYPMPWLTALARKNP